MSDVKVFELKTYDKSLIKYRHATEVAVTLTDNVPNLCQEILDLAEIYKKLVTQCVSSDQWINESINICNTANDTAGSLKKTTISLIKDLQKMMDAIDSENRRLKTTVDEKKADLQNILTTINALNIKNITPPAKPTSKPTDKPNPTKEPEKTIGENYLNTATDWLNTPYKSGGTSTSGIDCSGFTQAAAAAVGVELPRTTGEQIKCGKHVEYNDLRVGDLIFTNGGKHVVIFAGYDKDGNALTLGASSYYKKVTYVNLESQKPIYEIRRVEGLS